MAISSQLEDSKDILQIKVSNETLLLDDGKEIDIPEHFFSSTLSRQRLQPSVNNRTLAWGAIPPQVPQYSGAASISETAMTAVNSALMAVIGISILLQIVLSIAFKKLLKLFSQLQLIVYLILINTNFPANMHHLLVLM